MYLSIACPLPIRKTFDYRASDEAAALPEEDLIGRRVEVPFGFRREVGVVLEVKKETDADPAKIKSIAKILDSEPLLTPELIEFGQWLSKRYLCSLGEALFALMPPGRGNPVSFKDPDEGFHHDDVIQMNREEGFRLTEDQQAAVKTIHDSINSHDKKNFLVYGVAAAGKTEVYASAVQDVLSQGKNALVLTPEIGLAHQTADYFRHRFGENNVLLWHSDTTLKTRIQNWWRMKRGEFPIVIGARSATLAPLPHLGIIIVDEEQDSAFKEDRKPRFHAREAALFRARQSGATALFGTATPSLELLSLVKEGNIEMVELKERAIRSSRPIVKIVDLTEEKTKGVLSRSLQKAMKDRMDRHEQVILFINKRGFHRFLRCPECGWVARCPNCDIAVVEHKSGGEGRRAEGGGQGKFIKNKKREGVLPDGGREGAGDPGLIKSGHRSTLSTPDRPQIRPSGETKNNSSSSPALRTPPSAQFFCHYCGQVPEPPAVCPDCGHKKLYAGGFGTQRVVEELKKKFPGAKIARWDRDAVGHVGDQKRIYEEFLRGEDDILVGTQMVAQGFNFPKVTLVGVLDADGPLHLPDFRAAEKTFHLLLQVAGRAGRAMVTGEVLVQTRHPDHYALHHAVNFDLYGFAEAELKLRDELRYPPYSRLVMVKAVSKKEGQAEKDAIDITDKIAGADLPTPVGILGPTPSKRTKKGKPQFQVIFKVPPEEFDPFEDKLTEALSGKSSRYQVNVDPEGIF